MTNIHVKMTFPYGSSILSKTSLRDIYRALRNDVLAALYFFHSGATNTELESLGSALNHVFAEDDKDQVAVIKSFIRETQVVTDRFQNAFDNGILYLQQLKPKEFRIYIRDGTLMDKENIEKNLELSSTTQIGIARYIVQHLRIYAVNVEPGKHFTFPGTTRFVDLWDIQLS